MVKFKQKLNILALLALVGVQTQVQARGQINNSTVSWGQIGATGAALVVVATATYGAYKWLGHKGLDQGTGEATSSVEIIEAESSDSDVDSKDGEVDNVPAVSWWSWWQGLPGIERELKSQGMSQWQIYSSGYQYGSDLSSRAKQKGLDVIGDFLSDHNLVNNESGWNGAIKRLQHEKKQLKSLSARLASMISTEAISQLGNSLKSMCSKSSENDIFAELDIFPAVSIGKLVTSWAIIKDTLLANKSNYFGGLALKSNHKKAIIELWIRVLQSYGRVVALEKILKGRIDADKKLKMEISAAINLLKNDEDGETVSLPRGQAALVYQVCTLWLNSNNK